MNLTIPGLSDEENANFARLQAALSAKKAINEKRSRYHDAKQVVRHLGIAIPPALQTVETIIEWPATAVEALENRIELDGFVIPGASVADFGLDTIWDDNQLGLEAVQAHTSALKYGPAFLAVMAGEEGEPDVVVRTLSATSTTGLWDANRRRLAAVLSVTGSDYVGLSEFILYLPDVVITASREGSVWSVERAPHSLGRCPVALLPFKPSPESPFGRSRITQGVMATTDRAVRSLLRMEVSAEFYSAPQRYILGADESAFTGPNGEARTGWEITLGKILALGMNEDDKNPQVGQFPQMTMQPHMDMVRSDAAVFAGMTKIPVNMLGIIHDNPASDAAMHTAYLALNKEAERAHTPFGYGWVDAMKMAVEIRDGREALGALAGLRSKWRNPATPTKGEASKAVVEQVQAGVLPPDSEVTLEQLGYDDVTIQRIVADRRRAGAGDRLQQLIEVAKTATGTPTEEAPAVATGEDPAALRQKFEALGVAIRAGVSPESAAAVLGLPSLKFTGAVPVSLRVPESDARELEEQ